MVIHAPQEEEVTSLHEMEMKLRDPGLWFNQKKPLLRFCSIFSPHQMNLC